MSGTVRAFVALRVSPTPLLLSVLEELAGFGKCVRAVAPDTLHLTLKFLGATDEGWLNGIERELRVIASRTPRFTLSLCGLDAFPSPARPSVIWTAVRPPDPVLSLAGDIEHALTTFGFSPDKLDPIPHVTLARVKCRPPRELAALWDRYRTTEFTMFTVNEIELLRSELGPRGPRYTPLITANLQ